MKNVRQVGMIWLVLIALCGCSVVSRQEEKNITLSVEHEALCDSKNTLNKKLCRQTMGQLQKFESDVNTYFKEKFNIDGFKFTGINFPYTEMQHGGFNATFQLEGDPYVMITDTFDYKDNKYIIRKNIDEKAEDAGNLELISALFVGEYLHSLPIEQIEDELLELGISSSQKSIFFEESSGRYFNNKNLIFDFEAQQKYYRIEQADLLKVKQDSRVDREQIKQLYNEKYRQELQKQVKLAVNMNVENDKEAREKFARVRQYINNSKKTDIFLNWAIFFYGNPVDYKVILENNETKEVIING